MENGTSLMTTPKVTPTYYIYKTNLTYVIMVNEALYVRDDVNSQRFAIGDAHAFMYIQSIIYYERMMIM